MVLGMEVQGRVGMWRLLETSVVGRASEPLRLTAFWPQIYKTKNPTRSLNTGQ